MCGIFGLISDKKIRQDHLSLLVNHSRQRGRDSSGLIYHGANHYTIKRADYDVKKLLRKRKKNSIEYYYGT